MRKRISQSDLPQQLLETAALDRIACVDRWTKIFGQTPVKYLSVRFMQRTLAREYQIRALGGYPAPVKRALKAALQRQADGTKTSRMSSPGSYLMREWNGRTYRVEVTSRGYLFDGRSYASLSTIAKQITGAHWSGPRFFGMTAKRRAS